MVRRSLTVLGTTVALGAAAAVPAAANPSGRVSPAEYQGYRDAAVAQAQVLDALLPAIHSDFEQCSKAKSGSGDAKQAWTEQLGALITTFHMHEQMLLPIEEWAGGLRARASAYHKRQNRRLIRVGGPKLSSGLDYMTGTFEALAHEANQLKDFDCEDTVDLQHATEFASKASEDATAGFDDIDAAVTSEP